MPAIKLSGMTIATIEFLSVVRKARHICPNSSTTALPKSLVRRPMINAFLSAELANFQIVLRIRFNSLTVV